MRPVRLVPSQLRVGVCAKTEKFDHETDQSGRALIPSHAELSALLKERA